jgi:serine phosphatase RsbU (regulator of sigma subunit)
MKLDLRDLIDHRRFVTADQTVGQVFHLFSKHAFEFMAVLDGECLLGMCAKRDIGMLLGAQYGYALFAQKPIKDHLRSNPVCVKTGSDIREVFKTVFSRPAQAFYDDVLLVGYEGEFLGLIHTQTLVRLQNRFHLQSIRLLEEQQYELNLKNAQIEADLRMCKELQRALLPERYPTFPPGVESHVSALRFYHRYYPFGLVGGDFFHVRQLSDFAAGIFIADVMGHGVRAALITAMLRALLEKCGQDAMSPCQLLAEVNTETTRILTHVTNEAMYITALYVVADARNRTIRYSTAGHPLPIHVQNRLGLVEIMEHPEPGTVLGVFEDATFCTHEESVEPEDWVLLVTDGIFEVEDAQGREFGLGGVKQAISEGGKRPIADAVEHLLVNARRFSKDRRFGDDVCLLAIEFDDIREHSWQRVVP